MLWLSFVGKWGVDEVGHLVRDLEVLLCPFPLGNKSCPVKWTKSKSKKVRALVILRGEVVAGFNFACSAGELQKRHVIIEQCIFDNKLFNYLFIYLALLPSAEIDKMPWHLLN